MVDQSKSRSKTVQETVALMLIGKLDKLLGELGRFLEDVNYPELRSNIRIASFMQELKEETLADYKRLLNLPIAKPDEAEINAELEQLESLLSKPDEQSPS